MTRSGGAGRAKPPAARAKPPKTKTQTTNEGRWTDEEHRKFLEAYDAMVAVDPARRRWPTVAAAVGTRSTTQCRSHAQKYFKKLRRAAKKRRAAPAAPAPAPRLAPAPNVVTDSDSSLDVSSTSRSPRPAAEPPQADYAAVPTPPVQPREGSFDDSLSPTSALLREPIVDDRENAALTVDDAPHLTGPISSWASLSMLDPGFTA